MTLETKWKGRNLKRLTECPSCGMDLAEYRTAEHIGTHSPEDFGL